MIGIILIAHAHIASETKTAVEYILKQQPVFAAVDVTNSDEVGLQKQTFSDVLQQMSQSCDGVLVMADIFGATPCNIAMDMIAHVGVEVDIELIAGFNLPCVIKTILEREHVCLADLAQLGLDAGQKYMRLGSQEQVVKQLFDKRKVA